MRLVFLRTHNVAMAALMQECGGMQGKTVAVILSGGNTDTAQFEGLLSGGVPKA